MLPAILLTVLSLCAPSRADDGGDDADEGSLPPVEGAEPLPGDDTEGEGDAPDEGEAGPPTAPLPIDLNSAREAPALTEAQHDFLKPRRSELPQNPYASTDFTAYALEFGEVKVGIATITAGILPRTQIGTYPALYALGIPNGNVKFNALRLGPVDLALTGDASSLIAGNFSLRKADLGGLASIILTDPWSVHVGATYGVFQVHGEPDLSRLSPLVARLDPPDALGFDDYYTWLQDELDSNEIELGLVSRTISGRLATDVRFNRRDSLILQGTAVVWRNVDAGAVINGEQKDFDPNLLPDGLFGVKEFFTDSQPIGSTYVVSGSWQWAWKNVDLRLGLGWSAQQPAWLLQAVELDYRFGGKTRRQERQIRKGWRRDKENIDRPDEAAPEG